MENKCLYCYKEIDSEELKTNAGFNGYHQKCSRKFFEKISPPELDFTEEEILELAKQIIKKSKNSSWSTTKTITRLNSRLGNT